MIVYNHPVVTQFVGDKINEDEFGEHTNVGYVRDNKLLAGCVFNWWTGVNVQLHIAGRGHWAKPENFKAIFDVVFNKLGCRRATAAIDSTNTPCLKLVEKLGFKEEGRVRQATEEGNDMILYGMLKEECRWL